MGKGKAARPNVSSWFGNEAKWSPTDFIPAWNIDELFIQQKDGSPALDIKDELTFDTDRPQTLPLYVRNDGFINQLKIVSFSLPNDASVGFNKETYVLQEAWDNLPENAEDEFFSRTDYLTKNDLVELSQRMYLVGSDQRSVSEVPTLVNGGKFKDAIIIIEDAGESDPPASTPRPVLLGSENNFYEDISNTDDFIYAGAGNDTLWGNAGEDTFRGDAGSDVLWGDADNDILLGEAGQDRLWGGNESDQLYGGSGHDGLDGGAGADVLNGMAGNDTLWGGDATSDVLFGGSGDDLLYSGDALPIDDNYVYLGDYLDGDIGNDTLNGGSRQDTLLGGTGNDSLVGGKGDDFLNGYGETVTDDSQFDTLVGGSGIDQFILGGSWGVAYVETGNGYAVIKRWKAGEDQIQLSGNASQYNLSIKNVIGSSALDTEIYHLSANGQRDRIGIVRDTVNVNLDRDFVFTPL